MKNIHYIYQDPSHSRRRSEGVELVFIKELSDEMLFLCNECETIWLSLDEIDSSKGVSLTNKMNIEVPTVAEICVRGLAYLVDLIRIFDTNSKKIDRLFLNDTEGVYFFGAPKNSIDPVVLAGIKDFYDDEIYFFSMDLKYFWKKLDDAGCFDFGIDRKNLKIKKISLQDISDKNLYQYIDGIQEISTDGVVIKRYNLIIGH